MIRRTVARRCVAGTLALLWAAATLDALAQPLRYAVTSGLEYRFEEQSSMAGALTLTSAGQSMPVQQLALSRTLGQAQVLETKDGRPSVVAISFDPASSTQLMMNGQPQTVPSALAGRSLTVRVADDAIASITDGDGTALPLDAQTVSSVRPFVVFDRSLLPGRNVDIGDAWPAAIRDEQGGVTSDLTLTVAAFDQNNGVQLATLDSRGTLRSEQAGSVMSGDVSGLVVVDVATGLPVAAYGSGDVQISGQTEQGGQAISIEGMGRIELKRVIAYGDVPMASAQLAMPSAPSASAQRPGVAPGDVQSGGGQGRTAGASDARLVGMFKGESVYSGATYSNTQLYWIFDGAGGVYYGAQTHWSANARDYNQDLVWSAQGSTDPNAERGRWQAQGGILSIQWEGGNVSRYAYGFEPNGALVLRNANTRKLINFYERVR